VDAPVSGEASVDGAVSLSGVLPGAVGDASSDAAEASGAGSAGLPAAGGGVGVEADADGADAGTVG
jgi:hypothetical protein